MKIYRLLIVGLFFSLNSFTQGNKVNIAIDISNSNMKCITTGRFFNLSTAGLGVDIKMTKLNMRLYGMYGFNTDIGLKSDVGVNYADNFAMKGHFLGGSFEAYFLDEIKRIRPYLKFSLLNEFKSNYENEYIDYEYFFPLNYKTLPVAETIYQGHNMPSKVIYGAAFYKSTPILFNMNGGISLRIVENFRLNLSAGYSLSMMKYKYVKWTQYDDFNEMMERSPMQKKALHSIAGQIGLNYVFSFQKKKEI